MKIRLLTASDLRQVLPMSVAIEAMKEAYIELSSCTAVVPQRLAIPVADVSGTTLVKPALTSDGLGAKLVSVFPGNRELGKAVTPGLVVALDRETGFPIGICEGTYLTALRTGAAVGAASDLLANPDISVAAVIGCGGQSRTLIEAIDGVRNLEIIRLYDRHLDLAAGVVSEMQGGVEARLEPVATSAEAVEGAGLVCTITTSATPVLDGCDLQPGCHVNGIGSFTPQMQELDIETVRRSRIFVDSLSAVKAEAGDLLAAEKAGATDSSQWIEIGDVARGVLPGRGSADEVTLFKSVGVAVQDVKAAAWALERAAAADVGVLVEL